MENACAHSLMLRNNVLYVGSSFGRINIRDIRVKNQQKSGIFEAHKDRVSCLIGGKNNGNIFYSGSFDGEIKKWDTRNLKTCTKTLSKQKHGIACMYESNDGNTLISGGADGIRLWDARDNAILLSYDDDIRFFTSEKQILAQSLFFVDSIAVNDDETELYVATAPRGVVVLGFK
jgi:WD40 repeat protein